MQEIYENIAENISSNPQMLAFLDWCRRVDSITIVGFGSGLSTLVALSTKPKTITIYDHVLTEGISDYQDLANEYGVQLIFNTQQILDVETIADTDKKHRPDSCWSKIIAIHYQFLKWSKCKFS